MGNSQDLLTMSRALTERDRSNRTAPSLGTLPTSEASLAPLEPLPNFSSPPPSVVAPSSTAATSTPSSGAPTPGSLAWWESQHPGAGVTPLPSVNGVPGGMDWWNASIQGNTGIVPSVPPATKPPSVTPPDLSGIEDTQSQQLSDAAAAAGIDISDLDLTTDAGQSAAISRIYAGNDITSTGPLPPDPTVNQTQSGQIQDIFGTVFPPTTITSPPPIQTGSVGDVQAQQIADLARTAGVSISDLDLTTDEGQSEAIMRMYLGNTIVSTGALPSGASVDQIQSQQILDLFNSLMSPPTIERDYR